LILAARSLAIALIAFSLLAGPFAPPTSLGPAKDAGADAGPNSPPDPPAPFYAGTCLPSCDPDDARFFAVAGDAINQSTLAGIAIVLYIGLPSGTTTFTVGVFDGDVRATWDSGPDSFEYLLYKDPLKNGSTAHLVDTIDSSSAADDEWSERSYSTDAQAQAPSGNYFYRLKGEWAANPGAALNNFKVRSTGQVSLAAGQNQGVGAGPQNIGSDPPVTAGDPNPGDTNDPNANSYDGRFAFFFYVPQSLSSITFWDGDADRNGDTDDPNTPNTDPDGSGPAVPEGVNPGAPQDGPSPYGSCCDVSPSIFYDVLDPDGNLYTNSNPSGDREWEQFVIGNASSNPDVTITTPRSPGLWRLRIQGMDAHNLNALRSTFEIYSNDDVPLPVNPAPSLEPDNEKTTTDNIVVSYPHTIKNNGVSADDFDLTTDSQHGWQTAVFHDLDGDGTVDPGEPQITKTGTLNSGQSMALVVQVTVPDVTANVDDLTTIVGSSRTEWALQDDAKDTTKVRVNVAPTARAGGPYVGPEGSPISFDAGGSSDPDSDPLSYAWDFDGDGAFDVNTTDPIAMHTFGDDLENFVVVLEVSDGNLSDRDTALVTVTNVAPSLSITILPSGNESDTLRFEARLTDPGSDDLSYGWWGHCIGWTPAAILYNEPSIGPDPDPSPDVHPRDETVEEFVTCGDDGAFSWNLKVEDDDGGVTTLSGTFDVGNLPPALDVSPPSQTTVDEGTLVTLTATAEDPGSDDLTFTWAWQFGPTETRTEFNDGVGPDPDLSPEGTFPFTASDTSSFTYGDDGSYLVTLTVADDDGGSLTYTTTVDVANVAPSVDAGADAAIDEGGSVSLVFRFKDPGFDQPAAGTLEDFTATVAWGYGPAETLAVVEVPGSAGVPTTGTIAATHAYGDNGAFVVTITVCDDDGGCASDAMTVDVRNVDPVILDVQAFVIAKLTLRVAGEKWHDVRLDIVWNGAVTGTARVVRTPGSPDRQSATIEGGRLQLLGDFRVVVYYTPDDDPVNGQPNGANPTWVILTMPDGSEVRLHHTFNVQHPATWTWTLDDFRPYLVGQAVTFEASASDVGSDDLTFAWDFGDGSSAIRTYFNDGVGPDPSPSPEVNPMAAADRAAHAFAAGTYTITLRVSDDDGGVATRTFTIVVG
jgi:hypothetical protein